MCSQLISSTLKQSLVPSVRLLYCFLCVGQSFVYQISHHSIPLLFLFLFEVTISQRSVAQY